ncbi:MAG: phosphate acetyltransferase [Nocardioidaceae bacterium]
MVRSLLVVPTSRRVGLTSACLGLLRALDERGVDVGYFKPLGQPRPDEALDVSSELVRALTRLQPQDPLPAPATEELLATGGIDAVLEEVVTRWQVAQTHGVVIVEGLNPSPTQIYTDRVNQAMARALDAEVILVGAFPELAETSTAPSADDPVVTEAVEHVAEGLSIHLASYSAGERSRVVGCIVSHVPQSVPGLGELVSAALDRRGMQLVAAIPFRPELAEPRVRDLVRETGCQVINEGDLDRRIKASSVFARSMPGGLPALVEGTLVVVPGDRHDVIMAASLAALNGVPLGALLLTAGVAPDPGIWALCGAALDTGLPVLITDLMTYDAVTAVRNIDTELSPDDLTRGENVMATGATAFDDRVIDEVLSAPGVRRLTPAAFRYRLVERAREVGARIVLPEGLELRTLKAAVECAERGIARPVLLGPPDAVRQRIAGLGLEAPPGLEVIDPQLVAEGYVARLTALRAHKGWTEDVAREHLLSDPITVGTMMVATGEADGLVSGAEHTTAHTVRPALQILGTAPDASLVSSVFFMCLPDEVLVYGDCAINPNPTAEQLADIAVQSAASATAFGIEPRVAMISFSTGESGAGQDVAKVAEATRIVRERQPDLAVDGPLQYDAATTRSVGKSKRPGSLVAGRATVFVFPDLDTGNTTYKAVQRSADVISIGPMLQGLAKPVNDLSRGALVEDIVYTIALTAVQAGRAGVPAV